MLRNKRVTVRGTINGASGQIHIPPANPYKLRVAGEILCGEAPGGCGMPGLVVGVGRKETTRREAPQGEQTTVREGRLTTVKNGSMKEYAKCKKPVDADDHR